MKFTADQLRERIVRNPSLLKLNPDFAGRSSCAQPEPIVRHEPLAAVSRANGDGSRYVVRICSYRVRLIDPDNLCAKAFVDCLRHSGVLPDDTAAIMDYRISQQKVGSKKEEHTEIIIERLT